MPDLAPSIPVDQEPWLNPQAKPFIHIQGVRKNFGDFTAVNDVDLKIYQGELFSLLGGSGCGKTTLLRMLAGFEAPSQGRIVIDGVDMTDIPPYERPVNMMFQSYALFPHMTVEQNVAYGLKRDKLSRDDVEERTARIIELVQLQEFTKRKPHQLSGGQRQRVALARSLVKRPKVLLLDEPLGALDKKLREHTQFELMNIQEKMGITFVVVTHDQEEAMAISHRIAVMNQGEICQTGTPTEIYEFPQSCFVADFIGNINMFSGRVIEAAADHVRIDSEQSGCEFYINQGISVQKNTLVWVAVRPEKITISNTEPENSAHNCVKGVVKELGYMGNLSIYRIVSENGKMIQVTKQNRIRRSTHEVDWEDEVFLSWHPSSAVVLTE